MPSSAPTPCPVPGCPVLTPRGRCAAHQVTREHARRNWDTRTWYRTRRWKLLRANVLHLWAYQCAHCRQVTDDLDVDHIQKHDGDVDRFWNPLNLQPLCKGCHSRKTQQGL